MHTHTTQKEENKSPSVTHVSSQKSDSESSFKFQDNRIETLQMRKLQEKANKYTTQRQNSIQKKESSSSKSPVFQLQKEKVADMVRTVKELTEGLDKGDYAIGGSLALQMWYWALNPDKPLTREPGDIDILITDREKSKSIGKKIIDKREQGLPDTLKNRMVENFPSKFSRKQMTEESYNGFGVDLKEGREDTRWGKIDNLLMPIIDIQEEYSLSIQSPEALLFGLLKKRKALEGKEQEQGIVDKDIDVALRIIKQFKAYQETFK